MNVNTNEMNTSAVEELDTARRNYDAAWRSYESARTRFMDSTLHEYGSVAARDRMAHSDLTAAERVHAIATEKAIAQAAWLDYLNAEAHLGMLDARFAPRHP
nr:hypothetical protein [Microbacterium barkeri]